MPHLFSKLRMRDVDFANRIGVSPMCQYSSVDGYANDWHFAHLAARAVGGAALVFTEAAAVTPEGRISPQDLGAWSERHFEPLERIARFINSQGARAGIQLAHAGRKGSTYRPGAGQGAVAENGGGWRPVAPSAIAFSDTYPKPDELTVDQIKLLQTAFAVAAERAAAAGFAVDRNSRRSRLSHPRVSVAVQQSPRRRLWRVVRKSDALPSRVRRGGAARDARALPAFCSHFGDRLGRRRMGHRPVGRARAPPCSPLGVDMIDCSSGGNLEKADIPVGAWVPDAVRRADPAGGEYRHRGSRHDHRAGSSRPDHPQRSGGYRACSRARCCATPTGRCTLRKSSGKSRRGQDNICAQRRAGRPSASLRRAPADRVKQTVAS